MSKYHLILCVFLSFALLGCNANFYTIKKSTIIAPTASVPAPLCPIESQSWSSPDENGNGTPASPFVICTPEQLNSIGLDSSLLDKSFVIGQDIDLASVVGNFNVIGNDPTTSALFNEVYDGISFKGSIDGSGFAIKNLTISIPGNASFVGFIGLADSGAVIKNIVFEDATINVPNTVLAGIVAGMIDGNTHVENIQIKTSSVISGKTSALGVGNTSAGTTIENILIEDSTLAGSLVGSLFFGTIAGKHECAPGNPATISRAGVKNTTLSVGSTGGGLVGRAYNGSIIEDSFFQGSISGVSIIGGLVGQADAGGILRTSLARTTITRSSGAATSFGWIQATLGPSSADNYYESGLFATPGIGVLNSTAVTPLTAVELLDQSQYTNFNFTDVWVIDAIFGSAALR